MASGMRAPPQGQRQSGQPAHSGRGRPPQHHNITPQAGPSTPRVAPPGWQGQTQGRPPVNAPRGRPTSSSGPPSAVAPSPSVMSGANQSFKQEQGTDPDMPPPTWVPTQSTPARANVDQHGRPGSSGGANGIPVKEWEAALPLPLPLQSITPLADEDPDDPTFGGRLPPMSEQEKESVKRWIETDKEYFNSLKAHKTRIRGKMSKWAENYFADTPWWEYRKGEKPIPPRRPFSVLFSDQKLAQRSRQHGRREVRFSPAQLKSMANVEDQILPVRLDIEHDQWKIKDTFMWNGADTIVSPEMFAQVLCRDFNVPEGVFVPRICAAIRQRVREFQDQVMPIMIRSPDATSGKGRIDPDGDDEAQAMFEVFRKARQGSPGPSEVGSSLDRDRDREQGEGSRSSVEIKTESGGTRMMRSRLSARTRARRWRRMMTMTT